MQNDDDDDLLSNIYQLIKQVGDGSSDILLELLVRITNAETLSVQLQERVDAQKDHTDQLWSIVRMLSAVVGVIVLIFIVATLVAVFKP